MVINKEFEKSFHKKPKTTVNVLKTKKESLNILLGSFLVNLTKNSTKIFKSKTITSAKTDNFNAVFRGIPNANEIINGATIKLIEKIK